MTVDRRRRSRALVPAHEDDALTTKELCQACSDVTGTTGAAIALISPDLEQSTAGASNEVSDRIEELQFTLGEGPAVDAYQQERPVLEPDLADPATPRWLGFTGPALKAGVRAVFGFPLHVGAAWFGVLDLYRDRPGPLDEQQHADALAMADVVTEAILLMQAHAAPGDVATELATDSPTRSVVHQAAGMISAQVDVSVAQAMVRLRAHAFSNDKRLAEVSKEVVARELRFA